MVGGGDQEPGGKGGGPVQKKQAGQIASFSIKFTFDLTPSPLDDNGNSG